MAKKYRARDLVAMGHEALWKLPERQLTVVFDDGEVTAHQKNVIFSAYMWDFYTLYPEGPTLKSHLYDSMEIGKNTHMKVLQKVMWDTYDAYLARGVRLDIEVMNRQVYEATNRYYNDFTYRLEAHVRSLNILDLIEIDDLSEVRAAMDQVTDDDRTVNTAHAKIIEVLRDPERIPNNPISRAMRNGLLDPNQVVQCMGPRGQTTDVDSYIFRYPIKSGYFHGIRSAHDFMIDSRLASKAQTFTGGPLRKTEYLNRQLQLLAHTLADVHPGDCGSEQYVSWTLKPKDLMFLAGKYYLTDRGLERLKETDQHLMGQTIQFRSVMYCAHPDSRGVCERCYGEMALSIPRGTNIGHVAATFLGEVISQKVLSTKHVEGSASLESAVWGPLEKQFIRNGAHPNEVLLAKAMADKPVWLTVRAREAATLPDVNVVEDINSLQLDNVSRLTEVVFEVHTKKEPIVQPIIVYNDNRYASLSYELLAYVRQYGWQVDSEGDYRIDLQHWDHDDPIFDLPMRHANMLDYAGNIERFIKAADGTVRSARSGRSLRKQQTVRDFDNPADALLAFYKLVTSRMNVNIVHLECLLAVSMIRSRKHRDHRLPLLGNKLEFGAFNANMLYRSFSAIMAFQGHQKALALPANYLITDRADHILDSFIVAGAGQ